MYSLNDVLKIILQSLFMVIKLIVLLGVHIDESLTKHEHVGVVCNRVAKAVGIIHRLRHFPRHILVMLYYALIFSHVNYCNIAWSNSHDYFITKLFVL